MKLSFTKQISLMSFFWCWVASYAFLFTVNNYLCAKLFFTLMKRNAQKLRRIVFMVHGLVLYVDRSWDIPKVSDSIVRTFPIDMVNLKLRPFSVDIQPSEAMRRVFFPFYFDLNIPATTMSTGDIVSFTATCRRAPRKISSIRIVMKERFDEFLSKHDLFRNNKFKGAGNLTIAALKKLFSPVPAINILSVA